MNLNLFEHKNKEDNFINKFIEELKKSLEKTKKQEKSETNNIIDEYEIYEKKKTFLDNHSRKNNELVWVMDENSVCISENGDGGPIEISEIDLPVDAQIGNVYEKKDGQYVYNQDITTKLNEIK